VPGAARHAGAGVDGLPALEDARPPRLASHRAAVRRHLCHRGRPRRPSARLLRVRDGRARVREPRLRVLVDAPRPPLPAHDLRPPRRHRHRVLLRRDDAAARALVKRLDPNLALLPATAFTVAVEALTRSQARYGPECIVTGLALAVAWRVRDRLRPAAVVALAVALPALVGVV